MDAGETRFRSILDKPLHQLTEEDISQLTREDCRKYLKEKGMRRPSWNKSQAIQQVISLKALLESSDDSGAGALRKIVVSQNEKPPQVTSNSADSVKEASSGGHISVSADETVRCGQKDHPESTPSAELGCRLPEIDNKAVSPRCPGAKSESLGQMTIFYSGKVNVYDGVKPDKARAIMHLAASPIHLPQNNPFCGTGAVSSFPFHLQSANHKHNLIPPSATSSQTVQTEVEGQASRQVSLQRYLEKRKDRGRFKSRKNAGFPSSSLEVYLNHQARIQTSNGQSSRSGTNSPPPLGLPQALCSSPDNPAKVGSLSVDLNDKGNDRAKHQRQREKEPI